MQARTTNRKGRCLWVARVLDILVDHGVETLDGLQKLARGKLTGSTLNRHMRRLGYDRERITREPPPCETVVSGLVTSQKHVVAAGYAGTHLLDRSTTIFNHNAASIGAIFSRYNGTGAEIERGAYQFMINRTSKGLRMTSAATLVTTADKLEAIGW